MGHLGHLEAAHATKVTANHSPTTVIQVRRPDLLTKPFIPLCQYIVQLKDQATLLPIQIMK